MPRSLTLVKIEGGKPGKVYYPIQIKQVPRPTPGPNQVLVRIAAAALNHRDLFIRQHLYPAIAFDAPMLADGSGTVVAAGPSVASPSGLIGRAVVLAPHRGWASDPAGPEDRGRRFAIVGSSRQCPTDGYAADYVALDVADTEPAPAHLTPAQAAALPLAGLTAWRAVTTKAGIRPGSGGQNVLVTGIGGGVALFAAQLVVAMGGRAFVTSADADGAKSRRAVAELGVTACASYRSRGWAAELAKHLPDDRPYFDAVIDGAGADVVAETTPFLRPGAAIVSYGMTVAPRTDWNMRAVLANVELKGSTMGSRQEFRDMVAFVAEHRIVPVVSETVRGLGDLDAINRLFDSMAAGSQFGKLVIEIGDEEDESAKL